MTKNLEGKILLPLHVHLRLKHVTSKEHQEEQ